MSAYLVGLVLDRYPGRPHLKITLLALADAASSETGQCKPSYDLIAGQTNTNRRTAIRNVQGLVDEGIVRVLDHGGFRNDPETGRQVFVSNLYEINVRALKVMPTWKQRVKSSPKIAKARRKASQGDTHDTVCAFEADSRTPDLRVCGQLPAQGDTYDTVCASPVTPCSSDTGVTLTKTLEPNPEGQGLSTGNGVSAVGAARAAEASERRSARAAAVAGLVAHSVAS